MIELLAFLILFCPAPKLINLSNEPWNERDKWQLEQSMKRCAQLYPRSPCVKKFIKVESLMYRAICGQEEGK
jgi:hypothetical protein